MKKSILLIPFFGLTFLTLRSQVTANFTTANTNIETWDCIQFTDLSTGNPTSWQWSFYGAYPSTSTEQNPTVCFYYPGTYPVSLTVTGEHSTDTHNGYITVTIPHSKLMAGQCNYWVNPNTYFYLDAVYVGVQGPEDYRLSITSNDGGPFYNESATSGGDARIPVSSFPSIETYRNYVCTVQVKYNGAWEPYGPICGFYLTPESSLRENRPTNIQGEQTRMNIFPNPSNINGFQIDLTGLKEENNQVSISIYDMFGKQVYAEELSHDQSDFTTRLNTDGLLSSGIYLINVLVNGKAFNQKVKVE